jgi:hypothetical protein
MARVGKHGESSPPSDRRPLHFAAFLLLADAALVALIVAFVPCAYQHLFPPLSS